MILLDYNTVRPPWHLPPYPKYHTGPYLEEYFYKRYIQERQLFSRTLIPIFWTSCYLQGINVQPYIDALPKDGKYFTVSQHDDAIKEILPEDTISFCAGGNNGGIPIPLICSPIPQQYIDTRSIFEILEFNEGYLGSFVGSNTHPVRKKMVECLQNIEHFKIITNEWSFDIKTKNQDDFFNITSKSLFTLCPRGYGAQSFRLYEAIQLGSVPVYIHDDNKWLPFGDIIDWDSFSVCVHEKDIQDIPEILNSFTPEKYLDMRDTGRCIYNEYFTLDKVYNQIYKKLHEDNNS